jgi:signal transduction histidine kinase
MKERENSEARLGRGVRLYHVIARINGAMIRAENAAALLDSVSRIAGQSGLFSAMSIALHAGKEQPAQRGACHCDGVTPGCFSAEFSRRLDGVAAAKGVQASVVFNNLAADSARHTWLAEVLAAGHSALASLPLQGGDGIVGTLLVLSREADFFDPQCLALLQQLAEDVAYLLCRLGGGAMPPPRDEPIHGARRELHELIEHLQTAREEERQLISRELHDELGQTLSALKVDVASLEKRLAAGDAEVAIRLARMKTLIAGALDETHRIVGARRPRVLEEQGLECALAWLGHEFTERTGVPCESHIDLPDQPYAEAVATTAFRCVQESLTNISRHAAASRVVITVRQAAGALKLCIVDDGRGIDADFAAHGRFGLLGLQQRAHALGGEMQIESRPRRGTTIRISLPAVPAARGESARPLTRWTAPTAPTAPSQKAAP